MEILPKKSQYILEVRTYGREITDTNWEVIEVNLRDFWAIAKTSFRNKTIEFENELYEIEADFESLYEHFRDLVVVHQGIANGTIDLGSSVNPFPSTPVIIPINVTSSHDGRIYNSIVESYIYDIFLVSNISAPASLNLYVSSLYIEGKILNTEISLTSTIFEVSYLQDISGGLLAPSVLSPDDTWRWYFDIRKLPTQVSTDPIERIFFALFHMARMSDTPTNSVWIFYCLETLFDTKVGENFRVLTERIGILLELEAKDISIVKKKLRNLYDFRSSLVHGGQPIIHPMHDDILDEEVAEQSHKIIKGLDFGYVLILSCLQKLVRNQWTSLAFTEIMTGRKAS